MWESPFGLFTLANRNSQGGCLVFDTYVKEVNAAGKFRNLDSLECKGNRAVPSRENLGHAFLFALQK